MTRFADQAKLSFNESSGLICRMKRGAFGPEGDEERCRRLTSAEVTSGLSYSCAPLPRLTLRHLLSSLFLP